MYILYIYIFVAETTVEFDKRSTMSINVTGFYEVDKLRTRKHHLKKTQFKNGAWTSNQHIFKIVVFCEFYLLTIY